MTFWLSGAVESKRDSHFLLVDRASHRHKFDNKLKDDVTLSVQRVRADIQDLVLSKVPTVAETELVRFVF